jgi:hypothetical protein
MKLRQRIRAWQGTVQHETKLNAFYFVALKFAGLPEHHILTDSMDFAVDNIAITIYTRSYYRKVSAASPPRDQRQHAQFAE